MKTFFSTSNQIENTRISIPFDPDHLRHADLNPRSTIIMEGWITLSNTTGLSFVAEVSFSLEKGYLLSISYCEQMVLQQYVKIGETYSISLQGETLILTLIQ